MKIAVILGLLAALAATVLADERHVVVSRFVAPEQWTQLHQAKGNEILSFVVALPQRNLDKLEKLYWERTDPDSATWRQWLSIEAILGLIAPPRAVHDEVMAWLKFNGAVQLQSLGDAIKGKASVRALSALFGAEFHVFEHVSSGARLVKANGRLSVPASMRDKIALVEGLTNFPPKRRAPQRPPKPTADLLKKRQFDPLDWDAYIVPQTLYSVYGIPPNMRASNANSSQGVIEWEAQTFQPSDLAAFGKKMAVPNINGPSKAHIIGQGVGPAQGESSLDIEYISATGLGVANWFWLNDDPNTWLYGWATTFFKTQSVPWVNSISYGWNEEDQCIQGIGYEECQKLKVDSQGYVARVNAEFMKIGLRGVTLVVASGDSGANGRTDEYCSEDHFNPDYPAASPYVTSVGATEIRNVGIALQNKPPICDGIYWFCVSGGTEHAVSYFFSGFASGGGFSNVAARPAYQTSAVAGYFKTEQGQSVPKGYYNTTGRGYPDIAAVGETAILTIIGGADTPIGGTSASSPIVAGMLSLFNDYLLTATNHSLGPFNPLLYKMAAAAPQTLTDITIGDNTCTESGCDFDLCNGYYCATGWDPVTGFGTVKYPAMLSYIKGVVAQHERK